MGSITDVIAALSALPFLGSVTASALANLPLLGSAALSGLLPI